MKKSLQIYILILTVFSFPSCTVFGSWKYNQKINNIDFSQIKYAIKQKDTTAIIGFLKHNTTIQGYPCAADWVHFNKKWEMSLFRLSDTATINNFLYQKDTWIRLTKSGLICTFPRDTIVQGYLCKGGGGAKGVQTRFLRSGKLDAFFTEKGSIIDGIKCKGGGLDLIQLNENGLLKECILAEDQLIKGVQYKKGTKIQIDPDGKIKVKGK